MNQPNVDSGEIAKFNALAERWWDPNSEFRPLHDINPLRLNYIDERLGLPGKKVIDIGCGGGLLGVWSSHASHDAHTLIYIYTCLSGIMHSPTWACTHARICIAMFKDGCIS